MNPASDLKRFWQGISDRLWTRTRPPLSKLYYTNGGIGDELMLTAIARAARDAGRPIPVLASYPEIWRGNTDPSSLQIGVERWHYVRRRGWLTTELIHLAYVTGTPGHIGEQMAAGAGVKLPADWRPILPVTPSAKRDQGLIVVQNSCQGARFSASTKEWPQGRWQELTHRLAGDFKLVQIGTTADPRLELAEDRRGRTTLREAAELIGQAALFLGLESGLQHVAAAMRTPAVIIYGGRSRPANTGYNFNRNITRSPACAGCGLNTGCPHHMICMEIPVTEVELHVREVLSPPTR